MIYHHLQCYFSTPEKCVILNVEYLLECPHTSTFRSLDQYIRMSWGAKNTVIWYRKQMKSKPKGIRSNYVGWAVLPRLFTGAIPLLIDAGTFWLLPFGPDPVRSSLVNLDLPSFQGMIISTPNLVRAPDRHSKRQHRAPTLKPFTNPSLHVTELQTQATTPSRLRMSNIIYSFHVVWFSGLIVCDQSCLKALVRFRRERERQPENINQVNYRIIYPERVRWSEINIRHAVIYFD